MATPLTEEEKERIRYHLGYLETSFGSNQAAASLAFGIPRPSQTIFLVESAIQELLTNMYAVERVRRILCIMDQIEGKLVEALPQLAAEKLGDMTLRGAEQGVTYPDLLEREYARWGYRLADILGVPVYPYSARYRRAAAQTFGITNVRVGGN